MGEALFQILSSTALLIKIKFKDTEMAEVQRQTPGMEQDDIYG